MKTAILRIGLNQCHLVSDKVGNFHGNKALVTFL